MILKVNKGHYQIVKDKELTIKTEYLGSGIAIGVIDPRNRIGGICAYVLPYREFDIELDTGETLLSGESLIPIFLEELKKAGFSFEDGKIAIAGGSNYKVHPKELDLSEVNLKLAKGLLKKFLLPEENLVIKTGLNQRTCLVVDTKEGKVKLNINGREEEL